MKKTHIKIAATSTNQQEDTGPEDLSQLYHIYRQAKAIVAAWNEFGPDYIEERIAGLEQSIKDYDRWKWEQLPESEQRRLGLPCGHPYQALYSTGFTSYCRDCEAQLQKDIEVLGQAVKESPLIS